MTDTALGRGDSAHESRVVVVVAEQAQPTAQVFDLSAVKKALPARDLVRNLRTPESLFKHLGLVVGAVQHAEVFPFFVLAASGLQLAAGAQALDACHHALGFVFFAVAIDHAHRLALAQFAEQRLRVELGVGSDHIVGRAQNGAGRAVILFELDDLERRVIDRQPLEVVQRGAAPAVDRLVVVAHRREAPARAHQQLEQLVLRGVGVLVFVHQHMAQGRLPFVAHRGVLLQQLERQADQVVKVHALVGRQPLFVARHDARQRAVLIVLGLCFGLSGVQPAVFPGADAPLPLARGRSVCAAAGVFDDARDVVAVQNAELRLQAQLAAVLAQHAHAQGMKSADQHPARAFADQALGALAHLGRSLVGEGDGGNLLGLQTGLNQPAYFVRDHARLARAGAGQYQARALHVIDGRLLGRVQAGQGG